MGWLLLMKLLGAIVSVGLAGGILARDHSVKANRLIAGFLLCNAWWATGEFFLYQETSPEVAASILRMMTVGWLPLGANVAFREHDRTGVLRHRCRQAAH